MSPKRRQQLLQLSKEELVDKLAHVYKMLGGFVEIALEEQCDRLEYLKANEPHNPEINEIRAILVKLDSCIARGQSNTKPDLTTLYRVGTRVIVIPNGQTIHEEFLGKIIGIRQNKYIQVRDQADNVFDCEPHDLRVAD